MRPFKPGGMRGPAGQRSQPLSLQETSQLLGLSVSQVLQMARNNILPGTKTTGEWLFPQALVVAWKERQAAQKAKSAQLRQADQMKHGLGKFKPMMTATESYDLSILDELDVPEL